MKRLLLLTAILFLFSSSKEQNWKRTDDGVIINLKGEAGKTAKLLKVNVVNERIIHVSATPSDKFSDMKSLTVIENTENKPVFRVSEEKDNLIVSTSEINATISLVTGQVIFRDKDNKVLLSESDAGRSFSPVTVEGTTGFKLRQVFDSPDNEAFYGLGQHQSDEFNYKGLNEVLYQYNTKVSVPFVVSNKDYGLLWDNYSMTWFGDPREYSNLDLFRLYDKNGVEGGLTATYYNASDTSKIFLERKESSIDYENLTTIRNLPKNVPLEDRRLFGAVKLNQKRTVCTTSSYTMQVI